VQPDGTRVTVTDFKKYLIQMVQKRYRSVKPESIKGSSP